MRLLRTITIWVVGCCVLLVAPAAQAEVLYDSTPSSAGIHPTIQDFEVSGDEFDTLGADDFTVPAGQTWTPQLAFVDGRRPVPVGSQTTDIVNVSLFASAGSLPAASPFYSQQLSSEAGTVYPDFTVALPGAPTLSAGSYWFAAQARMDNNGDSQNVWFWATVSTQRGSKAAYRNPGDGFGFGCTAFSVMNECVSNVSNPDFSFRLEGTRTLPPAPPPAKKKKCKKGRKLKKGKCVKKKGRKK